MISNLIPFYLFIYIYIYIYTELAPKLSATVEHWSGNPEDAGSIPSRKALDLHFSQLVLFRSYNVYLNDTRISYTLLWLSIIRFVVSATYKTETNRRRIARLASTNRDLTQQDSTSLRTAKMTSLYIANVDVASGFGWSSWKVPYYCVSWLIIRGRRI